LIFKKTGYVIMIVLIILSFGVYSAGSDNMSGSSKIILSSEEANYLENRGPVKMCVDPDWYPYEKINEDNLHKGIAADLVTLIAQRTGVEIELVPTKDWEESIQLSKDQQCDILSFLNETEERTKWLSFTTPYFVDYNVLITREEHSYISDLSRLLNETLVLPIGTSIEERIRKDYPNLNIVLVSSEQEAMEFVSTKKADFTLRSLTMAAYTIRKEGLFNLKIAGQIPLYENNFSIGVNNNDTLLLVILNKGAASITPEDIQHAVNKHIPVEINSTFDYKLFFIIFGIFTAAVILVIVWNLKLGKLNKELKAQKDELTLVSQKLAESETMFREFANDLEKQNIYLNQKATYDKLTSIRNRFYFDQRIKEEIDISNRYNTHLSLLMFDLDRFKKVNDKFGHDIGDLVLIKISHEIQKLMRTTDVFVRWGGEEFAVILPQTSIKGATEVAEKIRKSAEAIQHNEVGKVTVSVGVSEFKSGESFDNLFKRVDEGLYKAKKNGRNQICVAEDSLLENDSS